MIDFDKIQINDRLVTPTGNTYRCTRVLATHIVAKSTKSGGVELVTRAAISGVFSRNETQDERVHHE